jgi:tRNA(Ile)-lysidine synthase TilS/MesJ
LKEQREQKEKQEQKFRELISAHKGRGRYDCLVALSGGKDSTYTLHLMKNRYDLNILAYSFNNWFQSDAAVRNIQVIVQRLNVDHMTISPAYESFKKLINLTVSKELYSKKALERASAICITCISLIRYIGFKIALEKKIPFVVLGMTPGQASLKTSLLKMNAAMLLKMQHALFQPLIDEGTDIVKPYILEKEDFVSADVLPYSLNPLAFLDYDEDTIVSTIEGLGWIKPRDTDENSTNCLLNAYANQVHMGRYGYHPYAFEVSGLVREGCISREAGLKKLTTPQNNEVLRLVHEKLGIVSKD